MACRNPGYYEWLDRTASAAARRRELVEDKIRALFEAFGSMYGYRRVHAELLRAGERVGDELVRQADAGTESGSGATETVP